MCSCTMPACEAQPYKQAITEMCLKYGSASREYKKALSDYADALRHFYLIRNLTCQRC